MLIDSGLLGLAAEIEVGQNPPLFQWLNLLTDGLRNLIGRLQYLIPPARGIREYDQKENGRLALPIGAQRRRNAQDVRSKSLLHSSDRCLELCLVSKRPWNVHESIIARPGARVVD
jgi:hypothetical protein